MILFYLSHYVEHNSENRIENGYHISDINHFKVFVNCTKWIDELDADVDSLHIKRIGIEDLVSYVYIVRIDLITRI
jgi:hypothetical protein